MKLSSDAGFAISVVAILFGVLLAIFLVIGLFAGVLFNPRFTENQARSFLAEEHAYLTAVVNYIVDSGHSSFSVRTQWDTEEITIRIGSSGSQDPGITCEKVEEAIGILIDRGIQNISRYHNQILFHRWSNLRVGRGLIYLIDGGPAADMSRRGFTILRPLSESGWYFYERR